MNETDLERITATARQAAVVLSLDNIGASTHFVRLTDGRTLRMRISDVTDDLEDSITETTS